MCDAQSMVKRVITTSASTKKTPLQALVDIIKKKIGKGRKRKWKKRPMPRLHKPPLICRARSLRYDVVVYQLFGFVIYDWYKQICKYFQFLELWVFPTRILENHTYPVYRRCPLLPLTWREKKAEYILIAWISSLEGERSTDVRD